MAARKRKKQDGFPLKEFEKRLTEVDPTFAKRPESVRNKMLAAVHPLCGGAKIRDGRIIFVEDGGGRSLGRAAFVRTWMDMELDRDNYNAMPWRLFEDTPAKRSALQHRIQLMIMPSTGEMVDTEMIERARRLLGGRLRLSKDELRGFEDDSL